MASNAGRTTESAESEKRNDSSKLASSHQLTAEPTIPEKVRHPPGLYLLFTVEMWERFSYYGMRALLVLYLIKSITDPKNPGRGWEERQANLLYGWYTGLAYLLPLAGGYLADKFLGTHRSVLVGGTVIALGHIVLAITGIGSLATSPLGMSLFIGGLALIIIGTGYFKPCASVMVGQLYGPNDIRRDGAFTIFYMGINLGAFICPFICGTLGENRNWHLGFGAAALGMIAGLFVYLLGRPKFLSGIGLPPPGRPNLAPLFLIVSVILAGAVAAFYHFDGFGWIATKISKAMLGHPAIAGIVASKGFKIAASVSIASAILGCVIWFIVIQKPGEKGPAAAIFIFMIFNAFFWIAFEQAGSTLNVFAEHSTDRHLFTTSRVPTFLQVVPATWFQSVNPLCILILAPFFSVMWSYLGQRKRDPSQPAKIGLGLLFLGAGYGFMVVAGRLNATGVQVSMIWLVATYTFHTIGELCLSPTGLSFVTKAAPARYVSLLMGIWLFSNFLANLGGGIIASFVKEIEKGNIELPWYRWFKLGGRADFFLIFLISSVGAGLIILLLTPFLKRLYQ